MNWYDMATAQEVWNVLNSIGMEIEPFEYVQEEEYGHAVRLSKFNENTFYKAEQIWAEREGLA